MRTKLAWICLAGVLGLASCTKSDVNLRINDEKPIQITLTIEVKIQQQVDQSLEQLKAIRGLAQGPTTAPAPTIAP